MSASEQDPDILLAGIKGDTAGTGLVYRSNDGGKSWHALNGGKAIAPQVEDVQTVLMVVDDIYYAGTWKNGLYRSVNGGATWEKETYFPAEDVRCIKVNSSNPSEIYAATTSHGVVKSSDGGATWNACGGLNNTEFKAVWSIELDAMDPQIVYAIALDKGVYKSTDGGASWKNVLRVENMNVWDIKVSDIENESLWAVASNDSTGYLLRSTDGGNEWKVRNELNGATFCRVEVIERPNGAVVVGSWDQGLWVEGEDSWYRNKDVRFNTISEILLRDNGVIVSTWGNGIFWVEKER